MLTCPRPGPARPAGAPKPKFVPVVEGQTWASEHVLGVAKDVPEDIKTRPPCQLQRLNAPKSVCISRCPALLSVKVIRKSVCTYEKAAMEEANDASRFAEPLGEVLTDSTKKNLEMRVEAEFGATEGKTDSPRSARSRRSLRSPFVTPFMKWPATKPVTARPSRACSTATSAKASAASNLLTVRSSSEREL